MSIHTTRLRQKNTRYLETPGMCQLIDTNKMDNISISNVFSQSRALCSSYQNQQTTHIAIGNEKKYNPWNSLSIEQMGRYAWRPISIYRIKS